MTRLLVSVRNAAEAEIAVAAGADLIDIKEPNHGALGAADSATIRQVLRAVAGRRPVSVALGELATTSAAPRLGDGQGVSFVKLGLAGCGSPQIAWQQRWQQALANLPAHIRPVAVVYADWKSAGAPAPHEVLERATQLNCSAVLVDSFDKSIGGLLDLWPPASLRTFIEGVRQSGLWIVLAGSLSEATIPAALGLLPDYIAVRGAACARGRGGPIEASRVRALARLVNPNS